MPNFILRKIDEDLWARFKDRAQAEGHPLRWVVLELCRLYAAAGLSTLRKAAGEKEP